MLTPAHTPDGMPHGMFSRQPFVRWLYIRGLNKRKSSFWLNFIISVIFLIFLWSHGYLNCVYFAFFGGRWGGLTNHFVNKVFSKGAYTIMEVCGTVVRWSLKNARVPFFSARSPGSVDEPLTNTCSSLSYWLSMRELGFRLQCNCWYHQPLFLRISASVSCSHQSLHR